MIGLEPLLKVIELTLWTGKLKGERPLSLLIIAAVESNKSESVRKFRESDGVIYFNNFTPTSFAANYLMDWHNKGYHHIIIPDFMSVTKRQKYLVSASMMLLNSFMEEGVKELLSYAFQDGMLKLPKPVTGGVITTIARKDFDSNWPKWEPTGFLSRFLPFSYSYGQDEVDDIFEALYEDRAMSEKMVKLPYHSSAEVKDAQKLTPQLRSKAEEMHAKLDAYGFRALRHLRRLAKANALSQGRLVIEQEDIDVVLDLSKYLNLDYKMIGNKLLKRDFELEGGKNDAKKCEMGM